jgi:hypothetical protein
MQQVVHAPKLGNSASYMADEAMRCLREGQLESDVMPHEETLALMRTVDQLCHQWGAPFLEIVH